MNEPNPEAEYLSELEPIGAGSSGTVWAPRGGEPAFKQEHRGRDPLRMSSECTSRLSGLFTSCEK